MAFSKYCLEDLELPRWMVAAPCNVTWPMTILDPSLKLQASSLRQFESIKNPLALNLRVLVNFWSFVSFGLPFQCVLHTFLHLNPETVTCKTNSANSQVGTLHCLDCYGPNTSRATRKGVCFWIVLLRLLVHSKIDICNLNTHLVCPKKRNPEIWWFIIIFQCNPSLRQDHVNLQQCIRSFPLCLPFFFLAFCPAALPVARFHNGVPGPRHPCVFLVQSKFSWVWLGPVKMPTSCLSEPLLVRFLRFVTRFHGVDFSGHSLKRANRCQFFLSLLCDFATSNCRGRTRNTHTHNKHVFRPSRVNVESQKHCKCFPMPSSCWGFNKPLTTLWYPAHTAFN